MNGYVSKLCDINSIAIPEELLHVEADEQAVETQVRALSLRCAEETEAERVETGDIVHCKADAASYPDGRTILLFTGTAVPGAEEAAKAALGKNVGDAFTAALAGKTVELTVEKIVRRVPVEVTDAVIAALGIDGVTTVAGYRDHVRAKAVADQQMENTKMITANFLRELVANSSFVYDETALEQYLQEHMAQFVAECAEMGEEVPEEEIRSSVLDQMKQNWVAEAFCKSRGIEIDKAAIEEQADQMMEMMSLMGEEAPDRAELIEMAYQGECLNGLIDGINEIIAEKMGGSNGND